MLNQNRKIETAGYGKGFLRELSRLRNIVHGKLIDIWEDQWIPNTIAPLHKPIVGTANFKKVCHLFTVNKNWDENKLKTCFDNTTVSIILDMHIPVNDVEDIAHWNLKRKGNFIVKSLYNSINTNSNNNGNGSDWGKICRLKVTPSIKLFMWKAANSILPTGMRVAAILPNINTKCNLCNENEESLSHLFFKCNFAIQIWMHLNFDINYVTDGKTCFHEWLNHWFHEKTKGKAYWNGQNSVALLYGTYGKRDAKSRSKKKKAK